MPEFWDSEEKLEKYLALFEERNEISQKNSQALTEKTSAESGSSKISDLSEPEPEIVWRTEEREGSKISKICKYCY